MKIALFVYISKYIMNTCSLSLSLSLPLYLYYPIYIYIFIFPQVLLDEFMHSVQQQRMTLLENEIGAK